MPANKSNRDIQFIRISFLAGPNIWTYRPALEAWVDIGAFEALPSNTLPGFVDRLVAWLPGLAEHRCGIGEPGGFLLRLRDGTWMGHILEHVTLELQNLVGMRTGFGKARETSRPALYKVVVRSRDEKTSRACLDTARELLLAAAEDQAFDLDARLVALRDLAERQLLGPSTSCIVDGASARGIPFIRLSAGNLVQLGYGARARRIWTAETDRTSAVAESICSDKELTRQLLSSCGVPVPAGRTVTSPEDAWEAAEDIGLPVVVKPRDIHHGHCVFVDLSTEADVKSAYERARAHSRHVIVERFIRGNEHRLLVVGNQVVAATRGESVDATDNVHPSVAATATLAARVVGLDIAGIDVVAGDISQPLAGQRGAVVQVNAGPGLLMHLKPAVGTPRPVGQAIVDHLFAGSENGRIPIVGVTGSKGKTTVSRLVGRMLKLSGRHVGLACGDGLFFDRRRARTGNCADWASARRVLLTRSVEAAVFENGRRAILAEGLAYDRCQVGVVTNLLADDLDPEFYIESAEQLANVYRCQVDVVLDDGVAVLNANDERVAALASLSDGEVIFFSRDRLATPLADHRSNGGRAVVLDDKRIVLCAGADSATLTTLELLPIATPEHAAFQADNVLAAVAAAWALGISRELIRAVIETFDPTRDEALDKAPPSLADA